MTPTDDLERRLREAVRDRSGNEPSLSALQRAALCWKTRSSRSVSRDEAADEIARLRAENFKLAAGACNVEGGLIGDDHGHVYCSLKARIEALERELAEAVAAERERCAKVAEEYAVPLRANVESSSDAHTFALNTVGVVIVEAIAAAIRNGEAEQ